VKGIETPIDMLYAKLALFQ